MLLVTAGTAKCAAKDVVKAAVQHGSKDNIGSQGASRFEWRRRAKQAIQTLSRRVAVFL